MSSPDEISQVPEQQQYPEAFDPSGLTGYNPMIRDSTPDVIAEINPERLIEKIEHKIRGEWLNPETEKWELKYKALMNAEGISAIMPILVGVLDQNTTLSNLSDREVSGITISLGDEIIALLRQKWSKFAVEKSNLRSINYLILRPIYFALKRGYMQGDKTFLKSTYSSSQNVTVQRPQSSGFFSKFRGRV